ncbi:hypothetical protein [Butyrivibrio sp. FCS014]|uniref:hypothetical protein n=1 Tax=Butyrivibrio sp. FCS014 TaxID=1408304 RepID=UPI00046639EB|nr:hypothetical protein [Butyrivibrio sp. FCS014]
MIYAVDFDGTLSFGEWPSVGPVNRELVDYLISRQGTGDKVILWTCRAGKPLADAVEFCRRYGLVFDAVNDNLPEIIEQYGSNSRKITCDVYIDDRAFHVDDYEYTGEVDIGRIESALIRFADRVSMAV